ncbi:MAG: hypothetical protein COB59_11800 [Rhodospirillaceae bacterium]|nr:MAG: hypothetical protein COB59_11800 [Rhodospirillaceae bacterium]
MGQTSYEVQVMQGGRWRIHAQFPSSGRDEAIEEAKTLESLPGIAGIKVMRDIYDDQSGLHNATVIHKHTPKPGRAPAAGGKYAKYQNRATTNRMADFDDPFADENEDEDRPKGSKGLGVIVKMLLVLLFSIALTAVVTSLISAFMPTRLGDMRLVGATRANIIVGTAILCFLITVTTSFMAFMGRDELDVPELKRRQKKAQQQKQTLAKKKAQKIQKAKKLEASDEERAKAEMARIKREKEKFEKEQEQEQKAEDAGVVEPAVEEEPAQEKDKPAEEGDDGFSRLSPAAERHKASLMSFFGEAVRNLPPERKKMDNYNRFGLNLYLAGATEALGGEKNLDGATMEAILADALQTMGLKEEHAEAFSKRYEDYLLQDARYMEIFQSGRRSISDFMKGKKDATKELEVSLNDWNKPKAAEDPEREVVVMFTDIVGSTAMTHEKGNMAAQEVVRAHNRVVRDALAKTGGKEIKHTGDGIMASFENVTSSLLATQQMQMMIRMHNAQGPDLPLKVKIGINAGRVVMEEQDLYGVTVQMAARIVDKASADQIFISDTVYGMAKGGQWQFVKRGPYYMKGIAGQVFLQEVVWDDKADIAAMNAASLAERPALEITYAQASGQPLPVAEPIAEAVAEAVAEVATTPVPVPVAETPKPADAAQPPITAQQATQPQPTQAVANKAYAQHPPAQNAQPKPTQDA